MERNNKSIREPVEANTLGHIATCLKVCHLVKQRKGCFDLDSILSLKVI